MNRTSAPNSSSGLYVDDNPATSTQGTLLIATDLNQRQEEIVNTIELSGITPSSGDDTQLGQAVRKLAGNGDYCDETSVDLSSASTSIDLTSFFSQADGWVESWVWSGGDGTYQLDWDNATYSGKTIGGITANTLTADLKGDGQGRLTLRKQGNDARILYYSDNDGGGWSGESFKKVAEGELQVGIDDTGTVSTGSNFTGAFPVPFKGPLPIPSVIPSTRDNIQYGAGTGGTDNRSLTNWYIRNSSGSLSGSSFTAEAFGRWTASHPVVG